MQGLALRQTTDKDPKKKRFGLKWFFGAPFSSGDHERDAKEASMQPELGNDTGPSLGGLSSQQKLLEGPGQPTSEGISGSTAEIPQRTPAADGPQNKSLQDSSQYRVEEPLGRVEAASERAARVQDRTTGEPLDPYHNYA